jgi:hypothetical protein
MGPDRRAVVGIEFDMRSRNRRGKAIGRLYELALMGARHPDAITYGKDRDCFNHRLILETISPDHAEGLRLHREFIDDGIITAPRQTSRRSADGTRRSIQVQRVSGRNAMAALNEIHDREISPEFISVMCPKCPHVGDGSLAPWDDPEHRAVLERRRADLREEQARRLGSQLTPSPGPAP